MMKKNMTALALLGIVLAIGAVTTIRARDIERSAVDRHGLALRVDQHNELRNASSSRLSKDNYAVRFAHDERGDRLAANWRDKDADRFNSDSRLRENEG